MVQSIDLHIFIQKLADRNKLFLCAFGLYGCLFWRTKFADGLLVFDLSDSQICGFVGGKTFIYWFGISGAAVADLILLSLFTGSHKFALLVYLLFRRQQFITAIIIAGCTDVVYDAIFGNPDTSAYSQGLDFIGLNHFICGSP